MSTNFPSSLDNLSNPSPGDALTSPSHAGQHADANDAIEALQAKVGINNSIVTTSLDYKIRQAVTLTDSQTITNKTLTEPLINYGRLNYPELQSPEEVWYINTSTTLGGSFVSIATVNGTAILYTIDATSNFGFNFIGDGSTSLNSVLSNSSSITVAIGVQNGATGYYPTAFQIDGSSVTPKWQGGTAPTSGNANSIDMYIFTIIKVSSAPTYTVLGSATKFS